MTGEYPRQSGHGMLLVQLHGPAAGAPLAPVGARRMLARAGKRAGHPAPSSELATSRPRISRLPSAFTRSR
jgi:hypothetical protein